MKLIESLRKASFATPALLLGRSVGRHRTADTAFTFRMGAGFAGDINRGHPASIQPCEISSANPVTAYGQPVVIDGTTNSVRPFLANDAFTDIWGVTARPYPIQQSTTSQSYGAAPYGSDVPPLFQPIDVLRGGYIMVPVVGTPVKGGAVFIWNIASAGGHILGGFEAAAGSTVALNTAIYQWNSPADSNGIAELIISKF